MTDSEIRSAIIAEARTMAAAGLVQGTSGNISVRHGAAMLITPSAVAYERLEPDMIAALPLDGGGAWDGPLKPSTEWRIHLDILNARPEIGAVVHTHSPHATALAMARRAIPPCHYMIAAFGGSDVRCAGYARFGTQDLSDVALAALQDRSACLLANHGALAIGPSLPRAMWLAVELEALARQYLLSLGTGGPVLLTDAEIEDARLSFADYAAGAATR